VFEMQERKKGDLSVLNTTILHAMEFSRTSKHYYTSSTTLSFLYPAYQYYGTLRSVQYRKCFQKKRSVR